MADEPDSDRVGVTPTDPGIRGENDALSPDFVEAVERAIEARDSGAARQLAGKLHISDLADLLMALDAAQRPELVRLLGADFDYAALTEVDEAVRVAILETLPRDVVAEGVSDLESDDAVYLLEDLDTEDQEAILAQIPTANRLALERGLDYPERSAGRRMQTDFIAVPPFWTVGQTIDYMRAAQDLPDDFYELFVIDPGFRLLGTVPLNRLLRSKRPVRIEQITEKTTARVRADEDQEEVARLFERYDLVSAPVVDDADRLVGVITVDDVVDVIQEEADEDIKRLAGVGDEEVSDSVWSIIRGRFAWLLANLLTAVLASAVIGIFEGELQRMVALAVLMPIVASQGGNAATQTMTVVVRALATRQLGPGNVARVLGRELLVGLVNGLGFAVIIGVIAVAWFGIRDLGFVIGIAMLTNLLAGAFGGMVIPLAFNRLKIDPAIASGAFVTTITDVVGFFAFLGLAALWFGP